MSWWPEAQAHRDDYLNETMVYLTLEQGEVEAEYWFDRGWPAGDARSFSRHNAALEWGITERWMADGRVSVVSAHGRATEFDSARLESRYRFYEEGTLPVDLAASFEINTEREADGSTTTGIEPRLIGSKDIGERINFTLNLSEEIPLESESAAFLVALGGRFNWTHTARIGSEFQYNFTTDAGAAIPQVWFAFPRDITLKLGYAVGLDQEPEDFARIALEMEF